MLVAGRCTGFCGHKCVFCLLWALPGRTVHGSGRGMDQSHLRGPPSQLGPFPRESVDS